MYSNKEFIHKVGNKDYHFIMMHGQQNVKKTLMCFNKFLLT